MGDSTHVSGSSDNLGVSSIVSSGKASKQCLVASTPKDFLRRTFKNLVSLKHAKLGGGSADQIVFFLLKVASLEILRRFSRARCPFIWQGLQALQVLCYPPFKWIQRWAPFKTLVEGMQKLSRPLLFLSIATAFSNQSDCCKETSGSMDECEPCPESPDGESTSEMWISAEAPENTVSENWLLQLHEELEKQGITLPERISEDDLHRFYTAANGDFSRLLSSIKRTIRWRETYYILSAQDLEMWSHLVFWHGCDVKLRPCLIIRLGLACSNLASHDRPRFAQAVVSQIEHGVLHLVNVEDPRITVLIDCEGISTIKFPMQMMRSFSGLVQDHYPNRLGLLFVIRLPPLVRVIAQTFIQVLKPTTRQKVCIVGEMYHKDLCEHIQALPLFLEGKCTCCKCRMILHGGNHRHQIEETPENEPRGNFLDNDSVGDRNLSVELHGSFLDNDLVGDPNLSDLPFSGNCDKILRMAIIGTLMLFVFIALIAGVYDPDNSLFLL
ncbi:uncharacterized protein LOC143848888 [Tasmannia lanceolata]|uniref:uncharacterized protein LOC143848888 n=1 Tax=Tasmannia lanceolata TaxID=3420 RepID=UPI004062B1BF